MKFIAIRQEKDGTLYMSKTFFDKFTEKDLGTYRYQKIELTDEEFANVRVEDFVVDEPSGLIYFSTELQGQRLAREKELAELPIIQEELDKLSQDIIQMYCGAVFEDKEERLEKFRVAHNRFREITGKEPRVYHSCTEISKTE